MKRIYRVWPYRSKTEFDLSLYFELAAKITKGCGRAAITRGATHEAGDGTATI